eukprot:5291473-Pleurochrysis_carterae.AAC.1
MSRKVLALRSKHVKNDKRCIRFVTIRAREEHAMFADVQKRWLHEGGGGGGGRAGGDGAVRCGKGGGRKGGFDYGGDDGAVDVDVNGELVCVEPDRDGGY